MANKNTEERTPTLVVIQATNLLQRYKICGVKFFATHKQLRWRVNRLDETHPHGKMIKTPPNGSGGGDE
ncbi:MAG: hypothetical protein P8Q37_01590 [Porticoccaceae bacterium]|nr:hypothetical protein [Porticoccaceae bacterium]